MDYYKKRDFQDKIKKHWKALLSLGILITAAIVGLLVGFAMNGWDIVKWWNKGYGPTCVIVIVLGLFAAFLFWYFLVLIKGRKK